MRKHFRRFLLGTASHSALAAGSPMDVPYMQRVLLIAGRQLGLIKFKPAR